MGGILAMMGMKVKPSALREIIEEIDEDGGSEIRGEIYPIFGCAWKIDT